MSNLVEKLSSDLVSSIYPEYDYKSTQHKRNMKIIVNANGSILNFHIYNQTLNNDIYNLIDLNLSENLFKRWGGRIYKGSNGYYKFGKILKYVFQKGDNSNKIIDNTNYFYIGQLSIKLDKINYISYFDVINNDVYELIYEKISNDKDARNMSELIINEKIYENIIYRKYNYIYKDIVNIHNDSKKLTKDKEKYSYKNIYLLLLKIDYVYRGLAYALKYSDAYSYRDILMSLGKDATSLLLLIKILQKYPKIYEKIFNDKYIDYLNIIYDELRSISNENVLYNYIKTGKLDDNFKLKEDNISVMDYNLYILPQLLINDGLQFENFKALLKLMILTYQSLPKDHKFNTFLNSIKISKEIINEILNYLQSEPTDYYLVNRKERTQKLIQDLTNYINL